ncbi:hypothetical protein HYR54_05770 [Candidatus Acetothermia bacterium]|nr:hypothetical protein [Candidatus Acetothermia bacterium]MBI3459425.1 hypothetical protein [Candidatus Acetothermia bacterium]MBI3660554.1 hypothetical protein [Candidatus Acetothermia bacterium]
MRKRSVKRWLLLGIVSLSIGSLGYAQTQPQISVLSRGIWVAEMGQISGREVFTLTQSGDALQLTSEGYVRVPQKLEERVSAVLRLSLDYKPMSYTVLQMVEEPPGSNSITFIHGQASISGGQARVRREKVPSGTPEEKTLQTTKTWAVLEDEVLSHILLLPRLYQLAGKAELEIAGLIPLAGVVVEGKLSRLAPVQLVADGKESTAERLLLTGGSQPTELLTQQSELIGAVRSGQRTPFVYRGDLFPKGFQVK